MLSNARRSQFYIRTKTSQIIRPKLERVIKASIEISIKAKQDKANVSYHIISPYITIRQRPTTMECGIVGNCGVKWPTLSTIVGVGGSEPLV
jgi:hypothetical protein